MNDFRTKITQEVSLFADENPSEYKLISDKINSYNYSDFTNDFYVFHNFRNQLKKLYLNQAVAEFKISQDQELKETIIAIADIPHNRDYEILINLKDREVFEKVLQYAEDFLKGEDFIFFQQQYVNSDALFALVKAYNNPEFSEDVISFFEKAFEYAKTYAKENDNEGLSTSGDPNGSTLLELAKALSFFNEKERFAQIVYKIYGFSSDEKRNYAMSQASGFIAVLLTQFETSFDMNYLNDFIKREEEHSPNAIYLHQTLYTKWFLEKNTQTPLKYLKKNVDSNPVFFIFALTDLNCKEALPLFIEKQKAEKNPVIWEVYAEAIHRLETNFTTSDYRERMIFLYDSLTPSQRALGAESDNVFVKRAIQKQKIDDTIYETDQD